MTAAASRRSRLRSAWGTDADAVLLTDLVNLRWATGFTGTTAAALIPRDPPSDRGDAVLATDDRYRLRAAAEAPDVEILVTRRPAADLIRQAARSRCRRVAIEATHVTVAERSRLSDVAAAEVIELVDSVEIVEPLRASKDADEIADLQAACAATDAAFAAVCQRIRPGLTERDVEWLLIAALHDHGADGPAFDPIVASGVHAAIPHHRPTDRELAAGDLLTLDFGGVVAGQHADMTRTVVVGRPGGWQVELHDLVRRIQADGRSGVAIGAVPVALNDAAADAILAAGYSTAHGLGHGVGLQIHEEPWLTPHSTSHALSEGATVTIEPGIYLEGRGGVRIEDTLVVTDGGATSLTTSPRDLLEL